MSLRFESEACCVFLEYTVIQSVRFGSWDSVVIMSKIAHTAPSSCSEIPCTVVVAGRSLSKGLETLPTQCTQQHKQYRRFWLTQQQLAPWHCFHFCLFRVDHRHHLPPKDAAVSADFHTAGYWRSSFSGQHYHFLSTAAVPLTYGFLRISLAGKYTGK